jgi:putative endonuclease
MKGAEAEARALEFLLAQGHTLLVKNYRIRGGEIDLITLEGEVTVFSEIKHRSSARFGSALESISIRKAGLVRRAALFYLGRDDLACRFDVLALEGDVQTGTITWVKDAF